MLSGRGDATALVPNTQTDASSLGFRVGPLGGGVLSPHLHHGFIIFTINL